ncbi:NAD kinase [Devriesea agamarum]|uniref:NAD kinase n=1 Tax=Devriesea agamarum TaxID=472569 RepID=UPI00071C4B82|nr:NAD kinase [Devriesea agamarum]
MRRFLLYAHTGREAALRAMATVVAEMQARQIQPILIDTQADDIREACCGLQLSGLREALEDGTIDVVTAPHASDLVELAIVLGGDGTILRALEVVRRADIPVHGVNLGHVGFLAESEVKDLRETVRRMIDGAYEIETRTTLDVQVFDRGGTVRTEWALNEAALEKADRQKMVSVVLEIDGRPVSSFNCDGVLLSTSTGSTAYAFSAGGPVIWPDVDAFVVVPLAAHALFARPLVLGRSSQAAVELTDDNTTGAMLTLDGRRSIPICNGTRVETKISDVPVRLVRLSPKPFADRLVSKFKLPVAGWRGRIAEGT